MSDAVGLVGFYFALIGFISGLFFTRLDGWYGDVRAYAGKVSATTDVETLKAIEPEGKGLDASVPLHSFIVIGVFLSLLALLSYFVPIENASLNPRIFLYIPLTITVLLYWGGGILLIRGGKNVLHIAQRDITAKKSGRP